MTDREMRAMKVLTLSAAGVRGYMERPETFIAIRAMLQFADDEVASRKELIDRCE